MYFVSEPIQYDVIVMNLLNVLFRFSTCFVTKVAELSAAALDFYLFKDRACHNLFVCVFVATKSSWFTLLLRVVSRLCYIFIVFCDAVYCRSVYSRICKSTCMHLVCDQSLMNLIFTLFQVKFFQVAILSFCSFFRVPLVLLTAACKTLKPKRWLTWKSMPLHLKMFNHI